MYFQKISSEFSVYSKLPPVTFVDIKIALTNFCVLSETNSGVFIPNCPVNDTNWFLLSFILAIVLITNTPPLE